MKPLDPELKIIMNKMAQTVGLNNIDEVDTDNPFWYNLYTWTKEQQEEYIKWLIDYFSTNQKAYKYFVGYKSKNKGNIRKLAEEIVWQWGWRVGYDK